MLDYRSVVTIHCIAIMTKPSDEEVGFLHSDQPVQLPNQSQVLQAVPFFLRYPLWRSFQNLCVKGSRFGVTFSLTIQKKGRRFAEMARSTLCIPYQPPEEAQSTQPFGMPYDTAGDAIISSEIELHNLAGQM